MNRKFLHPLAVAVSLALSSRQRVRRELVRRQRDRQGDQPVQRLQRLTSTRSGSPRIRFRPTARAGARSTSCASTASRRSTKSPKKPRRALISAKAGSVEQKIGWFYRSGMQRCGRREGGLRADQGAILRRSTA